MPAMVRQYHLVGCLPVSFEELSFHQASFEHLPDQCNQFAILNTSLDEAHQDFVLDVIEAAHDVAFDDPVHLLLLGAIFRCR